MLPKLDFCIKELEGINQETKFMRTIYGRHEAQIDGAEKDIDALHNKVDKMEEAEKAHIASERIHIAAEKARSGSSQKWTGLVEFLVIALPAFAKRFGPWIVSGLSLAGAALWELIRK